MKKRLFVAVPLPFELKEALGEYIAQIKADDQWRDIKVRWAGAANLHITVCFLGAVEEKDVPGVELTLRQIVQNSKPPNLRFEGIKLVPSSRPRMIWVEFAKNVEFTILATRVAKELENYFKKTAGQRLHPLAKREIIPHATLGRIKGRVIRMITLPDMAPVLPFKVSSLELMASQTLPSGAVYTQLGSFRFTT